MMMIQREKQRALITTLLLVALMVSSVPRASAQVEESSRERRVTGSSVAAELRSPVATGSAPRTVEELRAALQQIVRRPDAASAQLAVKVSSLDTGRTLFEENAQKLLLPASVMKIYTVAAALDRLTPDYRFKTTVEAAQRPDSSGTVRGDLRVRGTGDPTISATFNNGDYFKAIDDLAASIAAAGVRRVEGDLVGDESYFAGPPHGFAWSWADLQWYYGAEVSALSVNNNALDLFIKPGANVGAQCSVVTGPPTPLVTINNLTRTTARGTKRSLAVYRALGENVIEVSGTLPLDDTGYTGSVTVSHPALVFVYMLRSALDKRGVIITGKSRTINAPARRAGAINVSVSAPLNTNQSSRLSAGPDEFAFSSVEIASRLSPPLSVIAAQTLKPSQNLYAELLLRTLGRERAISIQDTSEAAGIDVVKKFLSEAGIATNEVIMVDGSGLSRRDLITANSSVQLLAYMSRHRFANTFREALPVAGVDGTLARRMKGTPAMGNVRAKTGTIETVATLSGYVTSAAGERLAFAVFLNNYAEASSARRTFTDDVAVLLASFAGRS